MFAEKYSAAYMDDLWWAMHHAQNGDELVMSLTSYLDDSGSHDQSVITVIGGPTMTKIQYKQFSKRWSRLLGKFPIPEPLHMTDFVRPNGRHCTMLKELKLHLFTEAVKLINEHKYYSISVAIPQADFRKLFHEDVCRWVAGPYAFAFFLAVIANRDLTVRNGLGKIAYLVDRGFPLSSQLNEAHEAIVLNESLPHLTGSLTFEPDDHIPALQAADLIAWSARSRDIAGLTGEFEPLNGIFDSKPAPHFHLPIPIAVIDKMADTIFDWILNRGSFPSLNATIKA